MLRRIHERGTTIVLTTHYLEEADAIADRVIVIDHGEVIADDSATRLKSGLGDLITPGFTTVRTPRRWRDLLRVRTRLAAAAQAPNKTGTPVNLTMQRLPDAAAVEPTRRALEELLEAARSGEGPTATSGR